MNSYSSLNAELGLNGLSHLGSDREASRKYFTEHVIPNTKQFTGLHNKLNWLVDNDYYEASVLGNYPDEFLEDLWELAYDFKFRFPSYLGALKFFTSYALKTRDGSQYLEGFEDRVVMTALTLARGNLNLAVGLVQDMMNRCYQPATPTFLNAGRVQRGELVSCYLLRIEDNMESIGRGINSALQLSKRGGGVALNLSNLREKGAPIKGIEGQCSGIIPVMKMLEDGFSYANQLGARQGAGAVYLNIMHQDILQFLDTKRENADEKIRIKTLSLGVVVPDIAMILARQGKQMALFSAYDASREYGIPFGDIRFSLEYENMLTNPKIGKTFVDPRELFDTIAEIQLESGYPYIMFEDTVNAANPAKGLITMSNLCVAGDTKILTSEGYKEIEPLAGTVQEIWNGKEWSKVEVVQTGKDQELVRVSFDTSMDLDCTPYHRFLVQDLNKYGAPGGTRIVRAWELQPGDRLARWELPLVDGTEVLEKAYTNGFFTADGCEVWQERSTRASNRLYLYGEKKKLLPHIEYDGDWLDSDPSRLVASHVPGLFPKFFVPGASFTIQSRLDWFAGYCDGDGVISATSLQVASVNKEFLHEVQLMLQTLGVASKVCLGRPAGAYMMPDGRGGQKTYDCQTTYRLLVASAALKHLVMLGFAPKRLVLPDLSKLQRSAVRYVRVDSVTALEGLHDTFCFHEPKREMGMFNGINTLNCTEILQVSEASVMNEDLSYSKLGEDISCNLGSLNVAEVMNSEDVGDIVGRAILALSAVSDMSGVASVPTVENGNDRAHAVGLGQMNLHGFLASHRIHYDSPEAIEFTHAYFSMIRFYALQASCNLARTTGKTFAGFDDSGYAKGDYLKRYTRWDYRPMIKRVRELFNDELPSPDDWARLSMEIQEYGLYNRYLLAVPPTGSISYINHATSSIHPIVSKVEIRKEGKLGRVYYPASGMTEENHEFYKSAYEIGSEAIIRLYAAATEHTDQGLSMTLFYPDTVTTRDLVRNINRAWAQGIKTIYYTRLSQVGLQDPTCVACSL